MFKYFNLNIPIQQNTPSQIVGIGNTIESSIFSRNEEGRLLINQFLLFYIEEKYAPLNDVSTKLSTYDLLVFAT